MLPSYFRNQLPNLIRGIVDHRDYDPHGRYVEGYVSLVEYCYPIKARNGTPFHTTLVSIASKESVSVSVGEQVCLHGVWVEIESVDVYSEKDDEEDGRTITFYTAVVREPTQRGA